MVFHMHTMASSESESFQKFGNEHFESAGHEEGAGPDELPVVFESHELQI